VSLYWQEIRDGGIDPVEEHVENWAGILLSPISRFTSKNSVLFRGNG